MGMTPDPQTQALSSNEYLTVSKTSASSAENSISPPPAAKRSAAQVILQRIRTERSSVKKQDRCPNAILPRKKKSACKQGNGHRQSCDSPCRQIVEFDATVRVVNHLVGSDVCPLATWTAPAGRRCDRMTTCCYGIMEYVIDKAVTKR